MHEHFFIVGAQRSGTTYLYGLLDEHPEIEMARPMRPEPKFFLDEALYQEGLEGYERRFFSANAGARLRGEKSVSYAESEPAAQRIARSFPSAKILFLLRDPVERAVSHYRFSVANGLESASMAEAFLHEEQRRDQYDPKKIAMSPFAYLTRGRYADQIMLYERFFPAENIKVLLLEQLSGSRETVAELYEFLGVARDFEPSSLDQRVNAQQRTGEPLDPGLEKFLVSNFAEPNARLAEHLKLPLARWWRS